MKKEIYIIRHCGPFVPLVESKTITFEEKSKNMILSIEAEKKMEKISKIKELENIEMIYSSNSARSIATAKYIAYNNNLQINIDDRLNERSFGITYIDELPKNFIVKQFEDEDYKLDNGESLNDVIKRLEDILKEILNNDEKRVVISLHGIVMMCFLKMFCNIKYNGEKFTVKFNEKVIYDEQIKLPEIFKLVFDEKKKAVCIYNVKY